MIDNNIITSDTVMSPHIGKSGYIKIRTSDSFLDTDINYTKEQEKNINQQNQRLYKREQHNVSFDQVVCDYRHPRFCSFNMIPNPIDKGYDYRDFPYEIAKKHEEYNPYIGYLQKNGLIGKTKFKYVSNYINIDSSHREKTPIIKTKYITQLDDDPLAFNGTYMIIYMPNTEHFNINDKIMISGISKKELTIRSIISDDLGNKIRYFFAEENKQYMTVTADINIQIVPEFIQNIKNNYTDMEVEFQGFIGDKKTEWYFNTRQYKWKFYPSVTVNGDPAQILRIVEDVNAITIIENQYDRADMIIAEFKIDSYGTVVDITPGFPYNTRYLSWIEPSQYLGDGDTQYVPETYYTNALRELEYAGLNTAPVLPTTIYKTMKYFEDVQNIIRPIFLRSMSFINSNFILRLSAIGKTYPTTVRIVIPETTKISTTAMFGNIPLSMLNSKHHIYLTRTDIDSAEASVTDTIELNKFYIKLNKPFAKKKFEFINPLASDTLLIRVFEESNSDVKISYRHFGGIPNKLISFDNLSGLKKIPKFKHIKDIVKNSHIVVDINKAGLLNGRFGGNMIYISLIENIDTGYPNSNHYRINLNKIYTNIVSFRMLSSAFPVSQKLIMDGTSGGRKNNMFYWQNMNDGDMVYKIKLDSGNYSPLEFKNTFERNVAKVPRIKDNITDSLTNHIIMDINDKTGVVRFTSYNLYEPHISNIYLKKIKLSDINKNHGNVVQLSIFSIESPELQESNIMLLDLEDEYYQYPFGGYFKNFYVNDIPRDATRIKINHPGHYVDIGQKIIIVNSLNYEDIPAKYLNNTHIVTRVGLDNYDILLYGINLDSSLSMSIAGGEEVQIYTPNIFRIRLDFLDTFGTELGFINAGNDTSITPYYHSISNRTPYDNDDDELKDSISTDPDTTNLTLYNSVNLLGPNYVLIVCDEISGSTSLGPVKDYFYRINLNVPYGYIAYNSFVDSQIFIDNPLDSISQLTLSILSPDGTKYDFNGIEHSFVLEIITYNETPEETDIRS